MARIYKISQLKSASGVLQFVEPNSKVLEFGPAEGVATRYMKEELNCKVTGIELVSEMAEIAKQYTEKIIVADIDNDNWEKELQGEFDYILFADVLEHLRSPKMAIQRASQFLAKEGSICVSVPNISHNAILLSLRKGKFVYTEQGLLDNTHIHLFTRQSLDELFEQQNFICEKEGSSFKYPRRTELKEYYISQPFFSLSILFKKDAHIYQFVSQWKKIDKNTSLTKTKGIRPSFYEVIRVLFNEIRFKYFAWTK